jgi:hypothetical protein
VRCTVPGQSANGENLPFFGIAAARCRVRR